MQLFHRIGATILVVIVLVSITASCFATPVTVTGIDFFTAAFQTFIEICGLTTVLSSNGVNSSSSDPYSQLQLTDQYQSLYDEYQTTLQTQETMSDWYTTYKDSVYVNVDSQASIISPTIDAQLSEWFSGFAGWILEDKYNCTRTESGFSHSSGTFDTPLISSGSFITLPVSNTYPTISTGLICGNNTWQDRILVSSSSVTPVFPFLLGSGNNGTLYGLTDVPGGSIFVSIYDSSGSSVVGTNTYTSYSVGNHYAYNCSLGVIVSTSNLPFFNTIDAAVDYYYNTSQVIDSISLRPKDKYNESDIPVPNVESNTYVPQALEGEYSDAITGALEGVQNPSLDDVLQAVLDAVTENEEVIADERVEPAPVNPVMPPFMPFDIPSFDFNLSGIWYYVTRWVNSIGNGVSLFFSIWSNIPPAMFYPVFGSAVVVIVIGVWKRFIA